MSCWITAWIPPSIFQPWNSTNAIRVWSSRVRSAPVNAPAAARVLEVGNNEEIGDYVLLDLGNDYTVTCGQLKEITAVQGEYLEAGQLLGYVAEPTKYYTIEGSNIFLEMRHGDKTVDPLDYLE